MQGAVTANGPICSQIGMEMLQKNGSAIDSAIATLLCEGVILFDQSVLMSYRVSIIIVVQRPRVMKTSDKFTEWASVVDVSWRYGIPRTEERPLFSTLEKLLLQRLTKICFKMTRVVPCTVSSRVVNIGEFF